MKKITVLLLLFSLTLPTAVHAAYDAAAELSKNSIIQLQSLGANSMQQRLGELIWMQDAPMDHAMNALWGHVSGRTGEYDEAEHSQVALELGYDRHFGSSDSILVGILLQAASSSTKYDTTEMNTDSYGFGLYVTWLDNSGGYLDVVARMLFLDHDVSSDDYDMSRNAYTLSAEIGKEMMLSDDNYATPWFQAGLIFLGAETADTPMGDMDVESVFAFSAKAGVMVGARDYLAAGMFHRYFKANIGYQKSGDAEVTTVWDGITNNEDVNLFYGGLGAGLAFKAESFMVYADLGADIGTEMYYDLNANVGVRYMFGARERTQPQQQTQPIQVQPVIIMQQQQAPAPAPAPVAQPEGTVRIIIYSAEGGEQAFYLPGFAFNSAELPDSKEIQDLVDYIKAHKTYEKVRIVGHTDNIGGENVNLRLSKARADYIAGYLGTHGIDRNIIETSGRAYYDPVATNETEEGRAKNRRVEIYLE